MIIAVVVVFPWVPETATTRPGFTQAPSASALFHTGIPPLPAAASSG